MLSKKNYLSIKIRTNQVKKTSPKKVQSNLTFKANSASTYKKFVEETSLLEKEKSKYNILTSSINKGKDKEDKDKEMKKDAS